jgi:hypothetical protein
MIDRDAPDPEEAEFGHLPPDDDDDLPEDAPPAEAP